MPYQFDAFCLAHFIRFFKHAFKFSDVQKVAVQIGLFGTRPSEIDCRYAHPVKQARIMPAPDRNHDRQEIRGLILSLHTIRPRWSDGCPPRPGNCRVREYAGTHRRPAPAPGAQTADGSGPRRAARQVRRSGHRRRRHNPPPAAGTARPYRHVRRHRRARPAPPPPHPRPSATTRARRRILPRRAQACAGPSGAPGTVPCRMPRPGPFQRFINSNPRT